MRYGWLIFALLCFPGLAESTSAASQADPAFSFRITGEATRADGRSEPIDFEVSFQQDERGWYFRAGRDVLYTDKPPTGYNLIMNLDGHGRAFIPDFSDHPLIAFTIEIDATEIELIPADRRIDYGLRLRINDRQFLFDSAHPRLRLELSENGLKHIYAEHTLRDLSIRRAN